MSLWRLEEISTTTIPQEEQQYREQDALAVADLTRTALEMMPDKTTSLLQERNLYALLGRSNIQIGARVDLVTRNSDGVVEHIDFKTGKIRDNTVQSRDGSRRRGTSLSARATDPDNDAISGSTAAPVGIARSQDRRTRLARNR